MIVWLASYPRSGNTLLRTLLKQTMGLSSKSDSMNEDHYAKEDESWSRIVGVDGFVSDWTTFYRQACDSDEVHLVKTHDPPIDDQPAIYVVRDGRKACLSYLHFHRQFQGGTSSLVEIVAGIDHYGDWSGHFRAWNGGKNTLTVKYEELVAPSLGTLSSLANVVAHRGPIEPWQNPFDKLREVNPAFFREGKIYWEGAPEWTPLIDALFFHLHGKLMIELGYVDDIEVAQFPEEMKILVRAARRLGSENKLLERACTERLNLINRLTSECTSLKKACNERLNLIDRLTSECTSLEKACTERLNLINRLTSECEQMRQLSIQQSG
jgi:Sulfotransferase domain